MILPSGARLRTSVVRDLACVMSAPSLLAEWPGHPRAVIMDAECARWLRESEHALIALDQEPGPLLAWLHASESSPLLGRYFEALLGFWIGCVLGAPRMESSIKVQRGKQVIGELDFVFSGGSGEALARAALQHWEVSVKYYLCTADNRFGGLRGDAFLGTMTRDRVDKKVARLREHQYGMARTEEGREALRAAGFESEPESRLLVKGALFYPWDEAGAWRDHPHPPEISPGHLRGWWSKRLPGAPDSRWVALERKRWLSPYWAAEGEPYSHAQLVDRLVAHFTDSRMAFMVARVERDEVGAWSERDRGLVVHEGWPWRVTGE